MVTKEDIGRRVLLRRRDLGLTQKQLAEKIGCPYQLISGLERGRQSIYVERFAELALALGMDANELLGIPPVAARVESCHA
jgi:transcriptional regulator with XRE-family HTH domain